jgi:hypothetical protein
MVIFSWKCERRWKAKKLKTKGKTNKQTGRKNKKVSKV